MSTKEEKIKSIHEELSESYKNFKAEVFVTEILETSSLSFSDIEIYNKSVFSRSYRRDIVASQIDNINPDDLKLKLILARNGLYDTLPEGVFHKKQKSTSNTYKDIRQKNKQEEKAARKFFSPIENELFIQKVQIEQNERALVDKYTDLKNDFLIEFWGLDKTLPLEYNLKLLKILPLAHKISGKIASIEACLGYIINENVTIHKKYKPLKNSGVFKNNVNSQRLDVDFVLEAKNSTINYLIYQISIGPMTAENANTFLPKSDN